MGQIVSSQSLSASSTLTSSAFPYDPHNIVTASCVVGATPPDVAPTVKIQGTLDNVTWYDLERRWLGSGIGQAYYQAFRLSDYLGAGPGVNAQALQALNASGAATWLDYRLYFTTGNQAVTVAAVDSNVVEVAEVTLAGTTSTSGGGIGSWSPPQGGPVAITGLVVIGTANSSGAANLSVGVAANATTSAANLINAQALGSSANTAIFSGTGTSAVVGAVLTGTQAVTFTGSANSSGFAGKGLITYVKP